MKNFIFFIVLFVIYLPISAQSNYKNAYIITNENDSIYGLVDFKTDISNLHICKFKRTESDTVQVYYPGKISGFRFINEGKFYVSREIVIKGITQIVFLEYLVQGLKNLYYYRDELEHYFIEDTNQKLIELSKKPDYVEDSKIITDDRYRGALKYIFRDYPLLNSKTDNAGFDRKTMIEFTKEYHRNMCSDGTECIIFENDYRKKFIEIDYSVYGGLQLQSLSLLTDDINDNVIECQSLLPVVGGQINIVSPRVNKSLGFYVDASFSKLVGSFDYFNNISGYSIYNIYDYEAYKLTGSLGLKYIYYLKKIRPTIEAGFLTNYLFSASSTLESQAMNPTNGDIEVSTQKNFLNPLNKWVGYCFAIGVDYQLNNGDFLFCKIGIYNTKEFYYEASTEKSIQLRLGYTL